LLGEKFFAATIAASLGPSADALGALDATVRANKADALLRSNAADAKRPPRP
jgi:hypothetical protein